MTALLRSMGRTPLRASSISCSEVVFRGRTCQRTSGCRRAPSPATAARQMVLPAAGRRHRLSWMAASAIVGGSWGIGSPQGSVTVAAEYRHHNRTNRASARPAGSDRGGRRGNQPYRSPTIAGVIPTRGMPWHSSTPVSRWTHRETRFLYAFGGFSRREANSAGFFRRALDARTWPQIYPNGFLPVIEPAVADVSATVRCPWRARADGATTSAASTGRNSFAFTVGDSLNVSLGPPRPRRASRPERWRWNQFVANVGVAAPVPGERLRSAS